jgi:hypothetical protein
VSRLLCLSQSQRRGGEIPSRDRRGVRAKEIVGTGLGYSLYCPLVPPRLATDGGGRLDVDVRGSPVRLYLVSGLPGKISGRGRGVPLCH